MDRECHVLIVEDSESLAHMYRQYLEKDGYHVDVVGTVEECCHFLKKAASDVLLLDMMLPDGDGLDILDALQKNQRDMAVIVMTAYGTIQRAVKAMRSGAYDFLLKPFHAEKLLMTVASAHESVKRSTSHLDQSGLPDESKMLSSFIGKSPSMKNIYDAIKSAAVSKAPVFITGETGTGKELCACAVHDLSVRHEKPFIALNCAAIPHELMESEIFGHVKGAYTGAVNDRQGAAEKAHGGTLFLDEVTEMTTDMQAKFLRFLQTNTFQKLGSSAPQTVDLRVICATNRDPLTCVAGGKFREDLYYRLHVVPIHMPPLKERGEDIILLADAFLKNIAEEENKSFNGISDAVQKKFINHTWPGNIRELQNVLRQSIVFHDGDVLTEDMLPNYLYGEGDTLGDINFINSSTNIQMYHDRSYDLIMPLEEVENEAIKRAIDICDGNITMAASYLQISPSTLYRRLKKDQDKKSNKNAF